MLAEKIKQHVNNDLQGSEELFYKTANIYLRPDAYYFVPLCTSTHGGIVESSPVIKQNVSSRLSSLGETLLSCLLHTKKQADIPAYLSTFGGKLIDPLLADVSADISADLSADLSDDMQAAKLTHTAAEVPSQGGFHTGTLAVMVQCYVGRIVFHPMSKKGGQNTYFGNPDAIFEVSTDLSVNELGKALRTSFTLAES